ncbi:hypothetical protein GGI23_000302 [Coemansia sp. RSA 2559]|nr:hypothetical protein GGI23_000302 [Coemansia sp. RSA 2559]KAJ2869361.1 hypothetical protein GGI22_000313 [Coemansia erecta]
MHSIRALARVGCRFATSPRVLAIRRFPPTPAKTTATTTQLFARFNSTESAAPPTATGSEAAAAAEAADSKPETQSVLPESLQIGPEDKGPPSFESINIGKLEYNKPRPNVRLDIWHLFVSSVWRLRRDVARKPKRSVLIWLLTNVQTGEELDVVEQLHIEWRMQMAPLSQASTQAWAEACMRLDRPDIFMMMLLDRWKYRHLPIPYNMARFAKYLGTKAAECVAQAKEIGDPEEKAAIEAKGEKLLDDAFRVFALYPYYDVYRGAPAYGALVEACCAVNTEEAWRRALVVSEEALALEQEDVKKQPKITHEALVALETRSRERNEHEMAERYKALAADPRYPTPFVKGVTFNKQGDIVNEPKLQI